MKKNCNILKGVDTLNLIYYMIEVQNSDYKLEGILEGILMSSPPSSKVEVIWIKEPITLNGLDKLKEELILFKRKKKTLKLLLQ